MLFRKNDRVPGMCERRVRNHNVTNIDKCDRKYLKGCDHSLPAFVCQHSARINPTEKKTKTQGDPTKKREAKSINFQIIFYVTHKNDIS